MRICDRCTKRHAEYPVAHYDLCKDCYIQLIDWIHTPPPTPPQPEPLVNLANKDDCTPCNKEEGEFIESTK